MLYFFLFVYIVFFLHSFLCPRHPHVLNVYFGVPGSGKTTFAAHLTKWALHENILIRFCRKHENRVTRILLQSKYLKRRIDVYSNVPITGAYRLSAKEDIGFSQKIKICRPAGDAAGGFGWPLSARPLTRVKGEKAKKFSQTFYSLGKIFLRP